MNVKREFLKTYIHVAKIYRKYPELYSPKEVKKFIKELTNKLNSKEEDDYSVNLAEDIVYSFDVSCLVMNSMRDSLSGETIKARLADPLIATLNLIPGIDSDIMQVFSLSDDTIINSFADLLHRLYTLAYDMTNGGNIDPTDSEYKSRICVVHKSEMEVTSRLAQYVVDREIISDSEIKNKSVALETNKKLIKGSIDTIASEMNLDGDINQKYANIQKKIERYQKKLSKETEKGNISKDSVGDVLSSSITAIKKSGALNESDSMIKPILSNYVAQIRKKTQGKKLGAKAQKILAQLDEFYDPNEKRSMKKIQKELGLQSQKMISEMQKEVQKGSQKKK